MAGCCSLRKTHSATRKYPGCGLRRTASSTAASMVSKKSAPDRPHGKYGLERRPLVGTAGRRPADDVPLSALGDADPGA